MHVLTIAYPYSKIGLRGVLNLDKPKTSRIARKPIPNNCDRIDCYTGLSKPFLQISLICLEWQIPNVKFHFLTNTFRL